MPHGAVVRPAPRLLCPFPFIAKKYEHSWDYLFNDPVNEYSRTSHIKPKVSGEKRDSSRELYEVSQELKLSEAGFTIIIKKIAQSRCHSTTGLHNSKMTLGAGRAFNEELGTF